MVAQYISMMFGRLELEVSFANFIYHLLLGATLCGGLGATDGDLHQDVQ